MGNSIVVGVVTSVCGKVKSNRDALATLGQELPIESVGFLGRGKAGVLADGPGSACIHRRLRSPDERFKARH